MQISLNKKVVLISLISIIIFIFGFRLIHNVNSQPSSECLIKLASYERLECLKPFIEKITITSGANAAMQKVNDLQTDDIIDDCHLAAHFVGEAQYKKYRDSVGKAFATCSMGCVEGCYHGVMEAYISDSKNIDYTLGNMPQVCDDIAHDKVLRRQCIHGIGHGILRHNSTSLTKALDLCKKFEKDARVCHGGVFMENINNYLLLDESSLKNKLKTICDEVENTRNPELIGSCYEAVGEGLMFYTGHDLRKSREMCTQVKKDNRDSCIKSAEKQALTKERQI